MSTFLSLLLNQKKKEENRSFQNREIWYNFNMTELTLR